MTKPTQAQIEAAELAKWIKQLKWKSVDKDNMEFEVRTTCYVKDALDKWADLTAAAQVGEPDRSSIAAADIDMAWINEHGDAINRTIERCAQVAEDFAIQGWERGPEIAAAIRKLKDNP